MTEAEMAPHVIAWIQSRGMKAIPELAVNSGPVDLVGVALGTLVAVEMKKSFKCSLWPKLLWNGSWANEVWVAVIGKPKKATMAALASRGIGVLSVKHGILQSAVFVVFVNSNSRWRERAFDKATRADLAVQAGMPCVKGDGPRIRVERLIRAYMQKSPWARSREVFENIPTHYANYKTFSGVFGAFIKSLHPRVHESVFAR